MKHDINREIKWITKQIEHLIGVEVQHKRTVMGGYQITALSRTMVDLGTTFVYINWTDTKYGISLFKTTTGMFAQPDSLNILDHIKNGFMARFDDI